MEINSQEIIFPTSFLSYLADILSKNARLGFRLRISSVCSNWNVKTVQFFKRFDGKVVQTEKRRSYSRF